MRVFFSYSLTSLKAFFSSFFTLSLDLIKKKAALFINNQISYITFWYIEATPYEEVGLTFSLVMEATYHNYFC